MAAIFFGKLGISGIPKDFLEDVYSIVSITMFFKYEFSFFPLMGFDDQLLVIFEKQTLCLFPPAFVVACSNSLPLLKSIIAS